MNKMRTNEVLFSLDSSHSGSWEAQGDLEEPLEEALEEDVGSLEGDFKSDLVHDLEPLNPAMPPHKIKFSALAADDARGGDEEDRGGENEQDAEAGEDPDHLSAVPDNGSSTVAKFALAVPGVVVTEQEVVI